MHKTRADVDATELLPGVCSQLYPNPRLKCSSVNKIRLEAKTIYRKNIWCNLQNVLQQTKAILKDLGNIRVRSRTGNHLQ